jgi:hypothetical protein
MRLNLEAMSKSCTILTEGLMMHLHLSISLPASNKSVSHLYGVRTMNIHQVIATVVEEWKADHRGELPARLHISKDHSIELGPAPTFTVGDISIPLDYIDMEIGAVHCMGQELGKAFVEANSLPIWARPPSDQS